MVLASGRSKGRQRELEVDGWQRNQVGWLPVVFDRLDVHPEAVVPVEQSRGRDDSIVLVHHDPGWRLSACAALAWIVTGPLVTVSDSRPPRRSRTRIGSGQAAPVRSRMAPPTPLAEVTVTISLPARTTVSTRS